MKVTNNVRFICTFGNYEKENSGRKRNHVVSLIGLADKKWARLDDFMDRGIPCTITNQRGYTDECFTRDITDVTLWDMRVIISW